MRTSNPTWVYQYTVHNEQTCTVEGISPTKDKANLNIRISSNILIIYSDKFKKCAGYYYRKLGTVCVLVKLLLIFRYCPRFLGRPLLQLKFSRSVTTLAQLRPAERANEGCNVAVDTNSKFQRAVVALWHRDISSCVYLCYECPFRNPLSLAGDSEAEIGSQVPIKLRPLLRSETKIGCIRLPSQLLAFLWPFKTLRSQKSFCDVQMIRGRGGF